MKTDTFNGSFFSFCLPLLAAVFFLSACNNEKRPEGLPVLHPCKIKVVQEGSPLAGVQVFLKSSTVSVPVSGLTDAEGIAKIFTMGKYPGAPEGEFTITMEKRITDPAKLEPKIEAGVMVYPNAKLYSLLEPDLQNATKSPHKITIEKKGNFKEIDAGKKVKIFLGNIGDPH